MGIRAFHPSRLYVCLVVGFWGLLGLAPSVAAQSGVVSGIVEDEQQNRLEGVEVQLINRRTAQVLRDTTAIDGTFAFSGVPAGEHSLAYVHSNYTVVRTDWFEVLPGVPVEVPAKQLRRLQPALTRPRAGLEAIAIEFGLVREQIADLPVLLGSEGRTAVDKLLHLVPGMSPVAALELDPFTGRAATVSANGSRRSFINYRLDGASNNAQNRITGAQAANFGPPPEAIETFRVVTHTYSASEGRNAGAVVLPTFRSATEQWHGQLRAFWRPGWSRSLGSFDGSADEVDGWAGGGQLGGPIWRKKKLYLLGDFEGWGTDRRHDSTTSVLTDADRAGDFSGADEFPTDPTTGAPFPQGQIPADRLDPLMQKYLDALLPRANLSDGLFRNRENLNSSGQSALAKLDKRSEKLAFYWSHYLYRNRVREPLTEVLLTTPGTIDNRRQTANNSQFSITHTGSPNFVQTGRIAAQRLAIGRRQGHPAFESTPAEEFGFDYLDSNPGAIPDATLWTDTGLPRLLIAPFLSSESSAQTTFQAGHDAEYRKGGFVVRGGLLFQRGIWPFTNTENPAGSFSFPAPPDPPIRARGDGLRDLLLGRPGEFRLQTPRSLNLRWHEFAFYGEAEVRPLRSLQVTFGFRFESQPPAVDTLDRIAAFRIGAESERFPETLPNLIFPGDTDPDFGPLSRSTIVASGQNYAPRIGVAYSPTWDHRLSRWILGESGRSVFRGSYGLFYDHGTFAGASAGALFQATYPPFSVDNRFTLGRPDGAFQSPFAALPTNEPAQFVPTVARYPIQVFDRDFQNSRAHHWNFSWQRLLPGRVFISASYLGTRAQRLQRQRELNTFIRNPLRGFAFVRNMRLFSRYRDIRSFESSGGSRYKAVQIRANRYLHQGIAFDVSYNWSQSFDNGSTVFGDELVTEDWTFSNFDRRHTMTATWFYKVGLPRSWTERARWADRWGISGTWRLRSGLPLDARQSEDPTFTFERVGRPDLVGNFQLLDPSRARTFTMSDGREVSGRFAFDPTAFSPVLPTNFNETRPGTSKRNAYRLPSFQQWDLRISRPIETGEFLSMELGFDLLNVFNNRNWAAPFNNIDHPFFGIVRLEGVGRTYQAALKLQF